MGRAGQDKELGTLRAKSWIEAAKRRLHHNVLAIALVPHAVHCALEILSPG